MNSIIQVDKPIEIIDSTEVINNKSFIEANTIPVDLNHLRDDCIIPVFSKDNETTISHFEFIKETHDTVKQLFPNVIVNQPNIRVSHIVKGRVPSAIGKPAKELLPEDKTIYYERCAFVITIPEITINVNGNNLGLTIGGVRAYNQENLYSRKSLEKFKVFIGFNNKVCTNLCISTDGFSEEIRVHNPRDLREQIINLISQYDKDTHINNLIQMGDYIISENQFAHFIGKLKMYQLLSKKEKSNLPNIQLNDSQINTIVKHYYLCENFSRSADGSINLWKLYNLFTEANKSSYIDSNYNRNVSAYELTNHLVNNLKMGRGGWLLN